MPLYASNILQILYTVADMIIVGHVLGKVGLSAVSIGGDVANFLMFFATGFANAGQVIISQLLGAGKSRDLGRFIGNMMTFLFALAVILTFVCLGFFVIALTISAIMAAAIVLFPQIIFGLFTHDPQI